MSGLELHWGGRGEQDFCLNGAYDPEGRCVEQVITNGMSIMKKKFRNVTTPLFCI